MTWRPTPAATSPVRLGGVRRGQQCGRVVTVDNSGVVREGDDCRRRSDDEHAGHDRQDRR
jgi:hypothetical protein